VRGPLRGLGSCLGARRPLARARHQYLNLLRVGERACPKLSDSDSTAALLHCDHDCYKLTNSVAPRGLTGNMSPGAMANSPAKSPISCRAASCNI
jgi:hypothetical protein